jgi:hypothetical protein
MNLHEFGFALIGGGVTFAIVSALCGYRGWKELRRQRAYATYERVAAACCAEAKAFDALSPAEKLMWSGVPLLAPRSYARLVAARRVH